MVIQMFLLMKRMIRVLMNVITGLISFTRC